MLGKFAILLFRYVEALADGIPVRAILDQDLLLAEAGPLRYGTSLRAGNYKLRRRWHVPRSIPIVR